jgi:hypothetical protein
VSTRFRSLASAPELRLASWGFGLHLAWEAIQTPLYADADRELSYLTWTRLHCTLGDVLILLACFWGTALLFGGRDWIVAGGVPPMLAFVALGIAYTFWSEWWNAGIRENWTYAPSMPTLWGIGASPLLQWVVVPFLVWLLVRLRADAAPRSTAERRQSSQGVDSGSRSESYPETGGD